MEFTIVIFLIAGLAAGIFTGLAGVSAAAIIAPMLITFLGMDAYDAIGIALASDVLASATAAFLYAKNGHIDIKRGLIMTTSVLVFTYVGSYAATFVANEAMSGISLVMTTYLGLRFIIRPVTKQKEGGVDNRKRMIFLSVMCGTVIGFICGFFGAGGGMMMLFVLTSILGYDLKTAVGTSVMIMSMTAFTGAVSHMALGGVPNLAGLVICVLATLVGSWGMSIFALKRKPKTLNRLTGVGLTVLGVTMLLFNFVF